MYKNFYLLPMEVDVIDSAIEENETRVGEIIIFSR